LEHLFFNVSKPHDEIVRDAMKKKLQSILAVEDDLLVDLTLHDFPASVLREFAVQIVRPYYAGNLSEALKDLIRKTVADQEFLQTHMETR
jgi:hypothetical protein